MSYTDQQHLVSDQEVSDAFHGTNFGSTSPREVLAMGVLKSAMGYSSGHVATCILSDLGLIERLENGYNKTRLTIKGQAYLRAAFPIEKVCRCLARPNTTSYDVV